MNTATADAPFWDRIAPRYARAPIKDMAGYERTIARAGELLEPNDVVLEIGCGTGTTALRLATGVRSLTATDVSEGMIAIAREKARAQGCENVDFSVCAAEAAPGDAGQYDAVLAFNVLHLARDMQGVLTRAFHLLRPGGLLISKTPCIGEMSFLIRSAIPLAQWLGKAPHVAFFAGEALRATIAEAGFEVVEVARHGSGRKDRRVFIVARKP